jgi:hypothetical protein
MKQSALRLLKVKMSVRDLRFEGVNIDSYSEAMERSPLSTPFSSCYASLSTVLPHFPL